MHFKTIKRDKILPMIEQAKDKKEQKSILCDLLECKSDELDVLIKELEKERTAANTEAVPEFKSGKWSDIELEQLKKLHGRGLGSAEIAAKLGRLQKSVIHKLAELKQDEAQYELCEDGKEADDKAPIKKALENDELTAANNYARELEIRLSERDSKIEALEKALDASCAAEDRYRELVKEAEESAEETKKALALSEERLKNCREHLMKYDREQTALSAALAKSLEFIATLNGVISKYLKA